MNVAIRGKNIELSDSLKNYAGKKVNDLERLIQKVEEAPEDAGQHHSVQVDVELARTTRHHRKGDVYRAELNISVPGMKHTLHAQSKQPDIHLAIDDVKDDMQRQLREYREKRTEEVNKDRRKIKNMFRLSRFARRDDEMRE